MKTLTTTLIIIIFALLISCSSEEETPIESWNINISSVTDSSAALSWTTKIDTTNAAEYYQLWLNNVSSM